MAARGVLRNAEEMRALRETSGIGLIELARRDTTRVLRELTEDATTVADLRVVVGKLVAARGAEI